MFEALPPREQHLTRMLAFAATCQEPPVVSHWSAAVVHGLPFLATG